MIKCCNCGKTFEEEDLVSKLQYMGECWGTPAYESIGCCPYCDDDDLEYDYYPDDEEEEE